MSAEESIQDLSLNGSSRPLGLNDELEGDLVESPSRQQGLNLGFIVRLARRNALLISAITLATTGAAAFSAFGPPTYQGQFSILVEPITSQARSTDPSAISRDRGAENDTVDYPTLLQVLQSPELLSKIAGEIQSRYPDVTAGTLLQDIARKNLVVRRPGTNMMDTAKIVAVSYEGIDPERVQYILQKLSDGFLKFSLEYRRTRIGGGIQFIEDQLPGLQQRVNNLEAEIQALKQRYRITDPVAEGAALSRQLQETQAARANAQRELAEQQTLYANLQRQLGLTPTEALAAASLSENPRYQALLTQLKTVETQIAVKAARFNEESPVIESLRDQQRNLIALLNEESQINLGETSTVPVGPRVLAFQNPTRIELIRQYVAAGNLVRQLQVRNQAVSQSEAFLDQRLQQFPAISRQYNDLQQQLDMSTRTLNQFLTQRETLRIEAAQKEVPWTVISPATIARDATGKPLAQPVKSVRNLAMGAIAGLILGFAAALLREKRQDIFYGVEDIRGALKPQLLGSIPYREGTNQIINPLAGNSDTFSKAFNALYTNIRFLKSDPVRSLVVGSPGTGDGKTTIALNLALAAASMGRRVLLVDGNLRSPHIHSLLGLSNSMGLSELLTERVQVSEAVQRSSLDKNLSILTAGQPSIDSIRALGTAEMQRLDQRLRSEFDLIVYDTPDLSEFSDAKFLAAQSDGLLMAVGIGRTKRSQTAQVVAELNRFHLPVLGIVSNQSAKSATASYAQAQRAQHTQEQTAILENLGILKPGLPTSTKQ
ncbi:polysaccharide biosynthesis tyrosine autokinase [Leptothermofonsia sichuanensis E412]|uniref:GumC family protein n=1 Tax=Leptothermofonsia sichuanensis TaxID=2917832 RepID=UPI001CA7B085|nr:tyrosine-protein kinase domain-containing protein [Leptothermofonsia sichuanensis]QZZ19545.1 polysaccharide biosynthesis tyrosine autokinase [Leptothermofonsia sichuanensis E412]